MTLPELVRERLGEEEAVDRVPLGGDDELVVTPSRTLLYRSEGLLSGESIEEHSLNAERIAVSEGRRRSTVRLEHGLEGNSEFTVPKKVTDDVLKPVLSGVLTTAGVTDADESIRALYRLGELSLIITEDRVIKHIGNTVWDEEFEEFAFADVTGLDIERGDVSSQVIIEVAGRPERIKTPSDDARMIREQIERQLLAFHDFDSYEAFRAAIAPEESDEDEDDDEPAEPATDFEPESTDEDDDDLDADGLVFDVSDEPDQIETDTTVSSDGDIADELASLKQAVEAQTDALQSQQQTIEQLIDELRRGR